MKKRFLNELPESELLELGELIKSMAVNRKEILHNLYRYQWENGEKIAIDTKLFHSDMLMDAFTAWIKGDTFENIGESVLQSDATMVKEIFNTIGITEDNEHEF